MKGFMNSTKRDLQTGTRPSVWQMKTNRSTPVKGWPLELLQAKNPGQLWTAIWKVLARIPSFASCGVK